jgi:methylglutamate dehydrogenase subunit B
MLICCPFCGERDSAEFEFRSTLALSGEMAAERLYFRLADPARSIEHWQHVRGCRIWLELHRDLRSGQILQTSAMPAQAANGKRS